MKSRCALVSGGASLGSAGAGCGGWCAEKTSYLTLVNESLLVLVGEVCVSGGCCVAVVDGC